MWRPGLDPGLLGAVACEVGVVARMGTRLRMRMGRGVSNQGEARLAPTVSLNFGYLRVYSPGNSAAVGGWAVSAPVPSPLTRRWGRGWMGRSALPWRCWDACP